MRLWGGPKNRQRWWDVESDGRLKQEEKEEAKRKSIDSTRTFVGDASGGHRRAGVDNYSRRVENRQRKCESRPRGGRT